MERPSLISFYTQNGISVGKLQKNQTKPNQQTKQPTFIGCGYSYLADLVLSLIFLLTHPILNTTTNKTLLRQVLLMPPS